MNWHLLSIAEITRLLDSSADGLSHDVAADRLEEYGRNVIEEGRRKSPVRMFLQQFADFMIVVLAGAAVISGIAGDVVDTVVILAIILINAVVGFIQEYRAERAMEALKRMSATQARVIREGQVMDVPAYVLVPGDMILLEAGNVIPADVRFTETHQFRTDESALTGESVNTDKSVVELTEGEYAPGDRVNMGFKGTHVTNGRARAYVVATGMDTELGRIARLIQTEEGSTPLQQRLSAFGRRLSIVVLLICAGIFVSGWLRGEVLLTMLLTSISLAVAAIPEALPALITIALAMGAKRLARNNALVRKLPAVETLGSVTFICSDKTGTLTMNRMRVERVLPVYGWNMTELEGYDPLLTTMALCHDVVRDEEGGWLGDSTEVALAGYASEHGFDRVDIEHKFPRVGEIPFDSVRKRMSTIHQAGSGVLVVTKGAIEVLLDLMAPEHEKDREQWQRNAEELAAKGYRVMGFAIRFVPEPMHADELDLLEQNMHLVGVVGIIDPPRDEVRNAIAETRKAGIVPVMITGDHKLTARAIAIQLGIIESESDMVITGPELARMSAQEFAGMVERVRVYARVSPEQKLDIIGALKNRGHYVAMTGDGVNDAPALKNADIGIAMGINGTEVSKEAAHMILMDDNYATIVKAIRHGRRIFDNILKFIKYIMTGNSGELWAIILAPFFGLPIPLLAIHILWINLVTDGLPGLALASEKSERGIMSRPPRDPGESIFTRGMTIHILWVGLLMGLVTIGTQAWAMDRGIAHWQTMAFTVLCFSQMGHVMAIRSETDSLFSIGVFSNRMMLLAMVVTAGLQMMIIYVPFFNTVFRTEPLSATELLLTIAISSIVFWAVELEKYLKRTRGRSKRNHVGARS